MLEALARRRTQYALGHNLPVDGQQVESVVREAVRHSPSAFNSQSSRVVILQGDEHSKLWDIVIEELGRHVQGDALEATRTKIASFAAGAGSVLFFEDQSVIEGLQQKFPLYAQNFPDFSEQSSGMAQLAVWTALANIGVGASLQHYNPLIDARVKQTWQLPESWRLRAQMPFGSNEAPFGQKTFMPDADRFRSFA